MKPLQRDIRRLNGQYNHREAANKLNVGPDALRRLQVIYPPTGVCEGHAVFTAADLEKIAAHMATRSTREQKIEMAGYQNVTQAARTHGIPYVTWQVALKSGRIPRPTHAIGTRRYYTTEEAAELAQHFELSKKPENVYSAEEVAKMLRVSRSTVSLHAHRHNIGQTPTPRRRWYTVEDVEQLRQYTHPVQTDIVNKLDEYMRHLQGQFSQQVQAYAASRFEVMQAELEKKLNEISKQK